MAQVLPESSVLAGRYVIEARLGDGAMGAVYRARHVKFGRQFAIKVLHESLVANPKVVRRFEREAELAGRLRHTNVASVVDVGVTDDGLHFTAMELVAGDTLCAMLADGPVSETRMLDLAKQLCSGLQHAHDLGLIHRDFKPENVIVECVAGGREVARIVDWGVSILRDDAGDVESEDRLTTKGIVVGTPHYMAPEQARGGAIDHRIDLFALGLICFELLTGKLPFDGSGVDIARANLEQPTPWMVERNPDVHVDAVLEAIIHALLAKHPDERPASADAARELFELYERDRATCALLLGVELPVEDRRTGAIEQLDHSPSQAVPRDPEHAHETDEIVPAFSRRSIAVVAVGFAVLLALLLWLGLRNRRHQTVPPVATASRDPRVELAVVEARPDPVMPPTTPVAVDTPFVDTPLVEPPRDPALAMQRATPKKPASQSGSAAAAPEPPSAAEVAKLYGATGRELKALDAKKGMDATIELWPRYRWIRINEWIATPEKRAQITRELERLRADIHAAS
ncbi:MAG TPA: serine/threonine-protein kinase [Kofleriaceae bacterium]